MGLLPEHIPGEKLLTRLIDALERTGAGIFAPYQIRRVGKAQTELKRVEALTAERTRVEIDRIRAGELVFDDDGRLIPSPPAGDGLVPTQPDTEPLLLEEGSVPEELVRRAKAASTNDAVRRLLNLQQTAGYAAEETIKIAKESPAADATPERPIDDDWLHRWRTGAETFSDEDAQRLWAKVLAEENKNPGRFSLRTLTFLRDLDRKTAQLIERIAPFALDGRFGIQIAHLQPEFFEKRGVAFADLLLLEELGVLSGASGMGGLQYQIGMTARGDRYAGVMTYKDKKVWLFDGSTPAKPTLPVYRLSELGLQLVSLAPVVVDVEYFGLVSKLFSVPSGTKLQIGDWIPISGSSGNAKNLVDPI